MKAITAQTFSPSSASTSPTATLSRPVERFQSWARAPSATDNPSRSATAAADKILIFFLLILMAEDPLQVFFIISGWELPGQGFSPSRPSRTGASVTETTGKNREKNSPRASIAGGWPLRGPGPGPRPKGPGGRRNKELSSGSIACIITFASHLHCRPAESISA